MESIRENIEELLVKTNLNILQELARDILKVELEQNISQRRVLRKLQTSIETIEDEDLLKQIERKMQMPPLELNSDDDVQENGTKSAEMDRKLDAGNLLAEFMSASAVASERSAFQREFKIKGAIGDVGQRDKLSDISLLKQIEEGQGKGYSDKDIVSAVLKAITPGLYLRNVLETTENLTLNRLMKFLQSHYVENSTTDLYQALTSLAQSPQESSIQFTYRAMSLRPKLVLASKSPGAEILFDEVLAKRLFLKALETGLLSDAIVSEIKPLLKNIKVSGEDLIFAIGQASYADSQRSSKFNKVKQNRQRVGVNCVDSEFAIQKNDLPKKQLSDTMSGKQNVCAAQTSDNDVIKLLEAMRSDIASLKTEVSNLKKCKTRNDERESSERRNQRGGDQQEHWKKAKCEDCRQKQTDYCRHCFVCGGIGHIARRCPSSADTVNDSLVRK